MGYFIETGNTFLAGKPHPQLYNKLKNFCFSKCYLEDTRKHREGCECFKPRDLIIHHCCPMKSAPCIGCNCIHLPAPPKVIRKSQSCPKRVFRDRGKVTNRECKVIYTCKGGRKESPECDLRDDNSEEKCDLRND